MAGTAVGGRLPDWKTCGITSPWPGKAALSSPAASGFKLAAATLSRRSSLPEPEKKGSFAS